MYTIALFFSVRIVLILYYTRKNRLLSGLPFPGINRFKIQGKHGFVDKRICRYTLK